MNTKIEHFPVSTETPRQRKWRVLRESVYLVIALVLAVASVLGVLNPVIGT